MKQIAINPNNEPYQSEDFIKGFKCGAERQFEADKADRPQGEWIDKGRNLWGCSNCGMEIYSESEQDRNEFRKWCSRCGCRMKGADDEV